MSFLSKNKRSSEAHKWLGDLDFSCLDINCVIEGMNEEKISSMVKLLVSKHKDAPIVLSAAKILCRLAYPEERYEGIRKKLLSTPGAIPAMLYYGQQGHIRPSRKIEKYEIEIGEEIAKGAGGQVFRGRWNNLDVAIKVCGKQGMFFECVEAFRFETTVMTLLDHPNILKCYGCNEMDKTPFIVMPLCEVGDLSDILRDTNRRLSLALRMHFAIQLSNAMAYMHKCGLLHRDLKPTNVLVDAQMKVYLIDFGISRIWESKRPMTMNIGTTAWIAPEIFSGNGVYTSAVDVFSFGLILWEIITCQKPYEALGLQAFDIPLQVVQGVRPDIPDYAPASISQLIELCWGQSPKKRPTFNKIIERLTEIQTEVLFQPSSNDERITSPDREKQEQMIPNTKELPLTPNSPKPNPRKQNGFTFSDLDGTDNGVGQEKKALTPSRPRRAAPRLRSSSMADRRDLSRVRESKKGPLPPPKKISLELPGGFLHHFTQFITVKIVSIVTISDTVFWIGLTTGEICVIATVLSDSANAPCKIIHQFFAHKKAVTALVLENQQVWSISLSGETCCWNSVSYAKMWDHPLDSPLYIASKVNIGDENRIWITGESTDECVVSVWNPKDCSSLSRVVIVPPTDCDFVFSLSCIQQYGNFVLLAASYWIYIFDATTLQALSYWKAHDTPIHSLAVFNKRIFSFAENSSDLKLWEISVENGKMGAIKQIKLENIYSSANLVLMKRLDDTLWCFYSDGMLTLLGEDLQQSFKGSWMAGGVAIQLEAWNDMVMICTDRLVLGLSR